MVIFVLPLPEKSGVRSISLVDGDMPGDMYGDMPTKNPKLLVTLRPEDTARLEALMASMKQPSKSAVIRMLIRKAVVK